MSAIIESPLFSIAITILGYEIGKWLNKKTNNPLLNPILFDICFVILIMKLLNISLETYNIGGSVINMLLAPATAALAVLMYRQLDALKKNMLPVLIGTSVGAVSAMTSIFLMCKLFGLDENITLSLLPKSVTTPIAIEISKQLGGIVPITVAAAVFTGIMGMSICPIFIKLFRMKESVSVGIALGTCSHVSGTSEAVKIGELEGAMAGLSIGFAGIFTVIFSLFFL